MTDFWYDRVRAILHECDTHAHHLNDLYAASAELLSYHAQATQFVRNRMLPSS